MTEEKTKRLYEVECELSNIFFNLSKENITASDIFEYFQHTKITDYTENWDFDPR